MFYGYETLIKNIALTIEIIEHREADQFTSTDIETLLKYMGELADTTEIHDTPELRSHIKGILLEIKRIVAGK
jgi:hypothetical protein